MASPAEQLAANMNLRMFAKANDLKKRIWFTLGALIVYRLGTYVPLPGVNLSIMEEVTRQNSGGILGMLDMFSGGALSRMTIFALNIIPYISASIIVQLLAAIHPHFESLKKEGELGRKKLNQYTRYGTVFLAAIQAFALARKLQADGAALLPGFFFQMSTVIIIVGGTLFLMWLGEQITSRGIGNGISLIIFSGIVANLPQAALKMLDLGREGTYDFLTILVILLFIALIIAFIVFMERAQRRVIIQYPKRQQGPQQAAAQTNHLPLKINSSGVIPPIFASSILLLPLTIGQFTTEESPEWLQSIMYYLSHGKPLYILLFSALIIFFSFFYTALVFNPTETADNLKKSGAFIPGIRPGPSTANYLDFILTRLTAVGSIYLVLVCIIPELVMAKYTLPFYLGGTSLLIIVSVTMDTVSQVHSHLLAQQYESLIKKSKFGKRGR